MANKTQEMGPADLGLTKGPSVPQPLVAPAQKVFGVKNKTFSLILFCLFFSALPFEYFPLLGFVAFNVLQLLPAMEGLSVWHSDLGFPLRFLWLQ